jgi:hypothetical protein
MQRFLYPPNRYAAPAIYCYLLLVLMAGAALAMLWIPFLVMPDLLSRLGDWFRDLKCEIAKEYRRLRRPYRQLRRPYTSQLGMKDRRSK